MSPAARGAGLVVWLAAAPAAAAHAQRVSGVVYDSLLSDAVLPNATLWVEGAAAEATTDSYGRFRFDSVAPGLHRIALNHASFDSAGVGSPTWRIDVPPAGVEDAVLAVRSPAAQFSRRCTGAAAVGSGFLVGVVNDAASGAPVAGATVHATWSELAVIGGNRIQQTRPYRRVVTDDVGSYVVCDVPTGDGQISVWASRDSASTGQLKVQLNARGLVLRRLHLAPRGAPAARLEGFVRDTAGAPLADARVFVRRGPTVVQTGPSGGFTLEGAPGGSQVLEVAAIGYEPAVREVELRPGGTTRVDMRLEQPPQILPPLQAVGRLGGGRLGTTFLERARNGWGHYLTSDQIERRMALSVEDLLRGMPGLQVQSYGIVSSRGPASLSGERCGPRLFVDGSWLQIDLANGDPIPVPASDVAGIEVYSGPGPVPIEYQQGSGCGVVAIWTKRGALAGHDE